jgi:type I restriction enzyme M protein
MNINHRSIEKAVKQGISLLSGITEPARYRDYIIPVVFLLCGETAPKQKNALFSKKGGEGAGVRINAMLKAIENNNPRLAGIGSIADYSTLNSAVCRGLFDTFGKITITVDSFAFILDIFSRQFPALFGVSASPQSVARLLASLADVKAGEKVYDPACGYCSAFAEIAKMQSKVSFSGQEIDPSTAAVARIYLFLRGIDADIACGDTLGEPQFLDKEKQLARFDVLIADAPFHIKNWDERFNRSGRPGFKMEAQNDRWHRFDRGVPRSSSDMAFLLHMVSSCASGGRAFSLVPLSVLFAQGSLMEIRKKLINENLVDTVIGLPERIFPRTSIPPCILVLKKDRKDNGIVFIDASRNYEQKKIYSSALKAQNILTDSGINDIFDAYQTREPVKNFSYRAEQKEIAANKYDLSIPRYIKPLVKEIRVDITRVKQEISDMEDEIKTLDRQISACLKEFSER